MGERGTNRLGREKSPYLLQHASNPVDWYPWGEEAFARARADDRPIFLSIGYSTCHWCHVMERESFEDPAIAALLARDFVSIKVDREERPDVDRVYMTFVQAATGAGGWPLSVFLTPGLEPFFGGTYFPPVDRPGRPSFATILRAIAEAWRHDRPRLDVAAREAIRRLAAAERPSAPEAVGPEVLERAYRSLARTYDPVHGGFGPGAPKFPRPAVLAFLLRYFARTGEAPAARMVVETLRHMARGGLHDQLGGGFHRYAVDGAWHVPHFEKMLYDQAQLVRAYVEGYQVTGDAEFARTARSTCDYVVRDLLDPASGAFLAAEDADSPVAPGGAERREGAFYVWTQGELAEVLGAADAELVAWHLDVRPEGNVEPGADPHGELAGRNVLHVVHDAAETAARLGRPLEEVEARLASARARLLAARARRPRPHRDSKVLCGWNGLMISGLARAGQVLGEPAYVAAAARAAGAVLELLADPATGGLRRRWRDGEAAIDGFLEDYAFLVEGLLDLYEASFDLRWLREAERLTERQLERFHDEAGGGFFTTGGADPSVLVRFQDDHDGAEPAGGSVAALNLLRLAHLVGRPAWTALGRRAIEARSAILRTAPAAMPQLCAALEFDLGPPVQVVLAGARGEGGESGDLSEILRAVHGRFAPNKVLLLVDEAARGALGDRLPQLAGMRPAEGRTTAYVCRGDACEAPTTEPARLRDLLPGRELPP